jgi:putative toxin-antitoxin system antitoxin component (TIGR02293 family)
MPAVASIVEVLGGSASFPHSVRESSDLGDRVREGFPYETLEAVIEKLHLTREELSSALHLPLRTLTRRKKDRRLKPDESDRLARLARIVAFGIQVLGDEESAVTWLRTRNRALGGKTPLELLDTDLGSRQVEEVLGRIEHGVFS